MEQCVSTGLYLAIRTRKTSKEKLDSLVSRSEIIYLQVTLLNKSICYEFSTNHGLFTYHNLCYRADHVSYYSSSFTFNTLSPMLCTRMLNLLEFLLSQISSLNVLRQAKTELFSTLFIEIFFETYNI